MNEVLTTTLIALGTGLASSLCTWIFGIRKHHAEGIEASVDAYSKLIEDLSKRVEDLVEENRSLREEVEKLREAVEKRQ